MRRVVLVGVVVALVFGLLGVGPDAAAAAALPPPSGALICGTSGTLKFTGPIPLTPGTKTSRVSASTVSGACDASGVRGGRAPIASVKVALSGTVPAEANCAAIAQAPAVVSRPKATITLLDANARRVASVKPTALVFRVLAGTNQVTVTGNLPVGSTRAFGGGTFSFDVTATNGDLAGCAAGTNALSTITFSGASNVRIGTFVADTTPPLVAITSPAPNSSHDLRTALRMTMTGTASDAQSGIDSVDVEVDGHVVPATVDGATWTVTLLPPASGQFTLRVVAANGAGLAADKTIALNVMTVPEEQPIVIAPEAHVLTPIERAKLTMFEQDGTLQFDATPASTFAVGDIVVSEPVGTVAPHGFLQRVNEVKPLSGGEVALETQPALLTDAIYRADVDQVGTFAPPAGPSASARTSESGLFPGYPYELSGRLEFSRGAAEIRGTYDVRAILDVDIDWLTWTGPKLNRFEIGVEVPFEAEASLEIQAELSASPKKTLHTQPLGDVLFTIGVIPVWIHHQLTVGIGLEIEVSAAIGVTTAFTGTGRATLVYEHGFLRPEMRIEDFDVTEPPHFYAAVEGSLRPFFFLNDEWLLYGFAGTQFSVQPSRRWTLEKIVGEAGVEWTDEIGVVVEPSLVIKIPYFPDPTWTPVTLEFFAEVDSGTWYAPDPSIEPPTNLRATPFEAGIQLAWDPSPTPGVTYRVYRVHQDDSVDHVASASQLQAAIMNLDPEESYTFRVHALRSERDSVEFAGPVTATPLGAELIVATTSLYNGRVYVEYNDRVLAKYGAGPYLWSVESGEIPDGLTFDSNGNLSGIPTTAGTYTFTVKVTSAGETATAPLSLTIDPEPASPLPHTWQSVLGLGTTAHETLHGTDTDDAGNVYIVGYTLGRLPGSPSPSAGNHDVFVAKYEPAGARVWVRQLGSSTVDKGYAIDVDDAGNVYISGETWGALPGATYAGNLDAFVAKYDTNGIRQWVRQLGSAENDIAFAVSTDADGNVFISGETYGAIPGAPEPEPVNQDWEGFIAKYDALGMQQWVHHVGSVGDSHAREITTDTLGNAYLLVWADDVPGVPDPGSSYDDTFMLKYGPTGSRIWARALTSQTEMFGLSDIVTDDANNIYVAGTKSQSPVDGSTGGAMVARYNTAGTRQWIRTVDVGVTTSALGMATDGTYVAIGGSIYLPQTNGSQSNGVAALFDVAGNPIWVHHLQSTGYSQITDVALGAAGEVYAAGEFCFGTVQGVPDAGDCDAFLAKH